MEPTTQTVRDLCKSSPTWCSLAWNYYYVGPDGDFRPCCRFNLNEVPESMKMNGDATLQNLFNSSFMEKMRESMQRSEKSPGCIKCYDEEKAGLSESYRQISNRQNHLVSKIDLQRPKVQFLELSYSNLCNIQCRTCTPYFSSAWTKQWKKLQEKGVVGQDRQCVEESTIPGIKSIDLSLLEPHLSDLRRIKFTGGEPLLIKQNRELLQRLVKMGVSDKVELNYSTNLTIEPDAELIETWKHFRHIEIAASLDGIGPVIEYVRYPTKWPKVERVLDRFFQASYEMSLDIGLRSAVSVYNVFSLPETMQWWVDQINHKFVRPFDDKSWINPSQIYRPLYLSVKVLPKKQKELVQEKFHSYFSEPYLQRFLNQIESVMLSEDHSHLVPEFRNYTVALDKIRGESFAAICPEFSDLIEST